jgi:hypothetical protein
MRYDHGEPWWNDIGRGKLRIRPAELSDNPSIKNHLVANQEELCEGNDEVGLFCSYFEEIFNIP